MSKIEAVSRAITEAIGGHPALWRGIVEIGRRVLPAVIPHLSASTALELEALFAADVGEGPTDPDPGF